MSDFHELCQPLQETRHPKHKGEWYVVTQKPMVRLIHGLLAVDSTVEAEQTNQPERYYFNSALLATIAAQLYYRHHAKIYPYCVYDGQIMTIDAMSLSSSAFVVRTVQSQVMEFE